MNKFFGSLKIVCMAFSTAALSACSSSSSGNNSAPASPTVSPESSECVTSYSYSSGVTVSGTAQFYKRGLQVSSSGASVTKMILGDILNTALPIAFAEIKVSDASGNIIQCGKTNSTGQLKALDGVSNLVISNSTGSYTIAVLSRSQHSLSVPSGKSSFKFYISVKKDIDRSEINDTLLKMIS